MALTPMIAPAPRRRRTVLLPFAGPLDHHTAPDFLERARRLCRSCRWAVLDLRAADYIDSDGVRTLLRLQDELEAKEGELRLVLDAGSRVQRTLSLLRLDGRLRSFGSVTDACAAAPAAHGTVQHSARV